MEEQRDSFYRPNCGMKYSINNSNGFCIHCGSRINGGLGGQMSINSTQQVGQSNTVQQPNAKKKECATGGSIIFLALSAGGVLTVLPVVVQFGALWSIFGALGDDRTTYFGLLYVCFGIALACLISLPVAFINFLLKGRYTKQCILIVFILTILGLLFHLL